MKLIVPKGFSMPMKTGGGAFATVYRMRQEALGRWVAVKVIREKKPQRRKKLLKEATVQARLSIPCIPRVYDAFEQGKSVYIIMEWIKGISLAQLLDESELSDAQRLLLADGIIRAVATLHGKGFAHRDIKPANILVSPRDGVFLIDFGFTKDVFDGERSMAGVVKGTPAFMAPELWKASPDVDFIRADVFSTGLIVRNILGQHPLSSISAAMLKDDPASRPRDGLEVLSRWESILTEQPDPGWVQVAGEITARVHAANLYEATRSLLLDGRIDDAYTSLVECLEEDPDMPEALSLMGRFPEYTQRRKFRGQLRLSVAAALVVAAVMTSFLIGRISRGVPLSGGDIISETVKETLRLKARRNLREAAEFDFHSDSLQTAALSGRLIILKHPSDGFPVVDEVAWRDVEQLKKGLVLSYGEHTVEWQSSDGKRLWRERMHILPFQTKSIVIHSHETTTENHKG